MAKIKLIEIGMDDPMERLFYERQAHRKKAYAARQCRAIKKNRREPAIACQISKRGFSQAASAAM